MLLTFIKFEHIRNLRLKKKKLHFKIINEKKEIKVLRLLLHITRMVLQLKHE